MLTLYRCLLYAYPNAYRREYAAEMVVVFSEAKQALPNKPVCQRVSFCARELTGLLCGALREQLYALLGLHGWNPFRRFDMRPEFRFPRSTVFLMTLVLAGVVLAIEKATNIELKYGGTLGTVWPALPMFFLFMLLTMSVLAASVWALMFALRRTGMHRLANIQFRSGQR
jgi:hypothetical protein